ncbi:TIGR04282 family arsenosugar biosynthesis glycosyltransferase [Parazoarcus communis]|nr:TIGR04282 family arsenosugar biosynthesis glycosyltransferase [Parazoarcus communis]
MKTMKPTRIIIFAKAPVAGYAKTRLIPALGADGASRLAQRMLVHTVSNALRAGLGPVELCAAPSAADPAWRELNLPPELQWSGQGDGDLGARMARAASRGLDTGLPVLLIGTDCPALDSDVLRTAAQALTDHDAAITPTADGGYALLGLNRFHASLFDNMRWSVPTVADETLERIGRIGWRVARLPEQHDIDEAQDLEWLPSGWSGSVNKVPATN